MSNDLRDAVRARLAGVPTVAVTGRVKAVSPTMLRLTVPGARIGDRVVVGGPDRRGAPLVASVVGLDDGTVLATPYGSVVGIGAEDLVTLVPGAASVLVGPALKGRILNGLGAPCDDAGPLQGQPRPRDREPPRPLARPAITERFVTGVRAIDGLLTVGRGQRLGIFAGSGVGKSSLLGALARHASCDVVVVALVGERGREVGDFLRDSLGEAGRTRSVVVCATSDASAPERLSAVDVATSVAEAFRDDGAEVLLLVDSLTRVCRAAREIGLSAGEPPARRGYPPSAFSLLPRLVERAGTGERGGSITAFYTVLLEGGDLDEPVADEVRGLLDGHVVLDRSRAERGQFPAIDPVVSLSRLASKVAPPEVLQHAQAFRRLESLRLEKRDLIALGAYVPGTDLELERALRLSPHFAEFLAQPLEEASPVDVTDRRLEALFATR